MHKINLLDHQEGRLRWFGHVERWDDVDWVKYCMLMAVDGT